MAKQKKTPRTASAAAPPIPEALVIEGDIEPPEGFAANKNVIFDRTQGAIISRDLARQLYG